MQRIQNSHLIARTAAVLAMLIPIGISGCAPLYHFVHYHPPSLTLADKHRSYYHSPQTGRIIPKDGCFTYCEPGCFGYEPTCWQPWPAECANCPVQEEVIISEKVIGGGVIYEATPGAPVGEPVMTEPHAQPAQPQPPRSANRRVASAPWTQQPPAASPTTLVSQPRQSATPPELRQKSPVGTSETTVMPVFPAERGPTSDHSEMVTSAKDFGPRPEIFERTVSSRRRTSPPAIVKADDKDVLADHAGEKDVIADHKDFGVATELTPQPGQPTEALAAQADESVVDSLVAQPLISNADADDPALESEKVQGMISPAAPLDDPFVIVSQPETTVMDVKEDIPTTQVTELDETADVHIVTERVRDVDPMERAVEVTDKVATKADQAKGQVLPNVTKPAPPLADAKVTEVTGKPTNLLSLRVSTPGKPMIRFAKKTERTVVKIDSTSSSKSSASLRFRD